MGDLSKLHIHIVDSVKGGSGKSTFSTKLCYSLIEQNKKACIVDLDLMGTSWYHLYQNAITLNNYANDKRMVFLNDLVNDFEYYKTMIYDHKIDFVRTIDGKQLSIPVIFCNPSPKAKKHFKITDKAHTVDVSFSFFKNVVFKLLLELQEKDYTHIIFDMPPNSDPYSNLILDSCLMVDKKFKTSLYMVSNMNQAHVKSTFEWYSDLINDPKSRHIISLPEPPAWDWSEPFNNEVIDLNAPNPEEKKQMLHDILKDKEEWLYKTNTHFFFVFNDCMKRDTIFNSENDCKAFAEMGGEIGDKLVFYFVGFDEPYSNATDSFYSGNPRQIEFGNIFDNRSFKVID